MKRVIALVDCNNFYVSCERLFRPDLAKRCVIVLSNNDGCIISRSQEAKAAGFPMGGPIHLEQDRIRAHNAILFSANFPLYGDLSERVMTILKTFTKNGFEKYSIDEAFMDLTHYNTNDWQWLGREIQEKVTRWTGIPVSVGIGESKTLAKVAANIAKQSAKAKGVLSLVSSPFQERALSATPIKEVWGVGARTAAKLESAKIKNALDLRNADSQWLQKQFSVVMVRTQFELQGKPCFEFSNPDEARKSILSSRSFGRMVSTLEELKEAVSTYTARAAEKAREDQVVPRYLTVYIKTNKFKVGDPQYGDSRVITLPVPTHNTPELVQHAHAGLTEIYRPGYRYKKAGIALSGLIPASETQQNLLDEHPLKRSRMQTLLTQVDHLNLVYGSRTLTYASEGFNKPWHGRNNHRSPRYTTEWSELREV